MNKIKELIISKVELCFEKSKKKIERMIETKVSKKANLTNLLDL